MTFQQELKSWFAPPSLDIASPPQPGSQAPSTELLSFPSGKPTIVTFLRHCGCPFAEKTFKRLRDSADKSPDIEHIAVSHSKQEHTHKWLSDVGGAGKVKVLVDEERRTYAKWGLGAASWTHVLSPSGLMDVYKVGKNEGIWNRPTESGSRWQLAGIYAVDKEGKVVQGGPAKEASEELDTDTLKSKL